MFFDRKDCSKNVNPPALKAEDWPGGPGALIFVDIRADVADDTMIVLCPVGGGGGGAAWPNP